MPGGKLLKTLNNKKKKVTAVRFTPDGQHLAAAVDNKIIVFEISRFRKKKTIAHHEGDIRSISISADSARIVSGGSDSYILITSLASGEVQKKLEHGSFKGCRALSLSPDGKYIAAGQFKTTWIWSVETGETVRRLERVGNPYNGLAFSPDGNLIAVAKGYPEVEIWSVSTGAVKWILNPRRAAAAVAFSPDGATLACGLTDNTISLWWTKHLHLQKALAPHSDKIKYTPQSSARGEVSVAPGTTVAAEGILDPSIPLGSGTSADKVLKGHTDDVTTLAFSPDGVWLASGSDDKTIRLWRLPDGDFVGCLYDKAATTKGTKGKSVDVTEAGRTVTYTLPCGAPLPAGAVCTCDCVTVGKYMPKGHRRRVRGGACSCDTICTCDSVCSCDSHYGGWGGGGGGHYWRSN
jgi:WD40 repeat protein